ncbi:SPRY-domain-containing protein [Basidiobolus meristosporus CBS 931.73]|uniref:SPRY-domain-containing protein n=1 Tax=Basidiobolus meristosporus CBS 931.73 TaxID=1314790 RepID=A0A1Y1XV51_9FUNG|nr:SPRY-domain-containing protein [Basidiobolus meristosporus CBS 931.73]|eukprot:ORX89555.1 SPRY-domain-containing protein [Basidiobolus meristosporus CBS 931.73]
MGLRRYLSGTFIGSFMRTRSMNPESEKEALSEATDILIALSQDESEFVEIVLTMIEILDEQDPLSSAFLCHIIGIYHKLGASDFQSVYTLLSELAALPSVRTAHKINYQLLQKTKASPLFRSHLRQRYRINSYIVWSVLAERLAGKVSAMIFTEEILNSLIHGLLDESDKVKLASLIALEKFAMTGDNKSKILKSNVVQHISDVMKRRIKSSHESNSLAEHRLRELNLCAPWSLRHAFADREKPRFCQDQDHKASEALLGVNVTLNWLDATPRLKWLPSGLEIRNDNTTFESARGTMCAKEGSWYYEVQLLTAGIMQIGWATKYTAFRPEEGVGVGDDDHSFAFDGRRKLAWSDGYPIPYGAVNSWGEGDVLGALLDMDYGMIRFYLNGVDLGSAFEFSARQLLKFEEEGGFYPAISLTSFQHVNVNFGKEPFRFPPTQPFRAFNDYGKLPESLHHTSVYPTVGQEKLTNLPLSELDHREYVNPCSICFDGQAMVTLYPCKHDGLCSLCAILITSCPFCRTPISERVTLAGTDTNSQPYPVESSTTA